jgi:hypothetical protein
MVLAPKVRRIPAWGNALVWSESQRAKLLHMSKARSGSNRCRERAEIILLAADRMRNNEISKRPGQDRKKVGPWPVRFAEGGLQANPRDKSRPGRIAPIPGRHPLQDHQVYRREKARWPDPLESHENGQSSQGKSFDLGWTWVAAGPKPHRIKSFTLSDDKRFNEKPQDIIRLYLSPPDRSQCQPQAIRPDRLRV